MDDHQRRHRRRLPGESEDPVLTSIICLFRRHDWYTWFDKEMRRNRSVCKRCGGEKSVKMSDSDVHIGYF